MAEYLLAEVLERQPQEVSRFLLRTSILERVSGPLADRLTGCSGSERILWELEDAGAFVVSLDAERAWFRYHRLFADLLALELRRTAPQELPGLHTIAAEWLAEHGHPVEAIRHAQAAENWDLATRVLADSWRQMYLDGRLATARELLSGFPAGMSRRMPSWRCSPRRQAGGRIAARGRAVSGAGGAHVGVGARESAGTSRSGSWSCGWRSRGPATIWTLSPSRRSDCSSWPAVQKRSRRESATAACE